MIAILRPWLCASSIASRIRWIEEEKQLKNSFFFACPKISSSRGRTAFSLGVYPLRSTLVESCSSARTPCLPSSANA